MLNTQSGIGEYVYSDKIEFVSEYEPPIEPYVFRTNSNIKVNPVNLTALNAELVDTVTSSGITIKYYDNGLIIRSGVASAQNPIYELRHNGIYYSYLYIASDDDQNSCAVEYPVMYDATHGLVEIAFYGVPYFKENDYDFTNFYHTSFVGADSNYSSTVQTYINLGTLAAYANAKSNISLGQLFTNIHNLYISLQ